MKIAQSVGSGKAPIGLAIMMAVAGMAAPARAGVCTVTATPINFGVFDPLLRSGVATVGSISYTCVGPVPAGIKIVLGPGREGSVQKRIMIGQDARLHYVLSLDPHGFQPWGDGSPGTRVFFDPHPPRGKRVTIDVFARILPDQPLKPRRTYSDMVSVLAIF